MVCSLCGAGVDTKVYDYSMKKYNKCLCYNCQKKVDILESKPGFVSADTLPRQSQEKQNLMVMINAMKKYVEEEVE